VRYRDFDTSHIDFQQAAGGQEMGIVLPALGADRTPQYNPIAHTTVASAGSFADWYHDHPVNVPIARKLIGNPAAGRLFFGIDYVFFPIDDAGLPERTNGHNFEFTMELHARFTTTGQDDIVLDSDDDSWLFIDQVLQIELGGVHDFRTASLDLTPLGFVPGSEHTLDLFYAERGPTTATMQINPSIACLVSN
jgi:fibro-slime domain-containing protein